MQERIAVAALALTNMAILVGWLVSGTQRVTEELTKERRSAYSNLLVCALAVRAGRDHPPGLAELAARAEFVATPEMFRSGLIEQLVNSVMDDQTWHDVHRHFVTAARFESHRNTATRRRLFRSAIYGNERSTHS